MISTHYNYPAKNIASYPGSSQGTRLREQVLNFKILSDIFYTQCCLNIAFSTCNESIYTYRTYHGLSGGNTLTALTGKPTVIGMSMLNTMILASTLVVTGIGFSTLHSTLPVLSDKSRVRREYGTCWQRVLCYQQYFVTLLLYTHDKYLGQGYIELPLPSATQYD